MTSSKQRHFAYNRILKDLKGSKSCVFKVRQYIIFQALAAKAMQRIYSDPDPAEYRAKILSVK